MHKVKHYSSFKDLKAASNKNNNKMQQSDSLNESELKSFVKLLRSSPITNRNVKGNESLFNKSK